MANEPGALRRFYRIFRWLVLAALVLVIALILRKAPPPAVVSDPEAKQRMETKLAEAEQARQAGQPHTLRVDGTELNSWLGSNLALAPADAASPPSAPAAPAAPATPPPAAAAPPAPPSVEEVRSTVRDVKIDLVDDRVRAWVLFDFHGADLSLLLEGRLAVQGGYLRFTPVSGKLGSLPLPQSTLDSAVARMFEAEENREKMRVPAEISDVRIENSQLVVSYR